MTRTRLATLLCALSAPALAQAQSATPASEPQQVVVVGAGGERRAFDTPYAVSVVSADELRAGGPMVNLSEALARVPGLTVNLRNNHAQDLQISSRGFGARASFGVRGMRLYTDGIPASMPDGQGQVSHFDLAGAQRIEVLRGPFSALYGNSSGGVISLVSSAPTESAFLFGADAGRFGWRQLRVGVETPFGQGWDLRAQASQFESDGPRPHSQARRGLANLRLGWRGELDSVTVHFNNLDQPAQDPLGLSRAQLDADPGQTAPQATTFDTRKTITQTQLGGQWRHRFASDGALRESSVAAYAGRRGVTQWLAIPVATQAAAGHAGGVVDFDREYFGVDAHLLWRWLLGQRNAQLVAGVSAEQQDEDRRGFENFIGSGPDQQLGVKGALRRDEANRARSSDVYAQGEIDLGRAFTATLGVRHGALHVRTRDAYLANGDDSGTRRFGYTTPVAALQWRPDSTLNLYLSAARGHESPTLNELAYRADGSGGLNDRLKAQRSRQLELGAKWRPGATPGGRNGTRGLAVDLAVFRADTDDEIGVQTNAGGRASFQNVGATRRQGLELATRWPLARQWAAQIALTWLDARYRDDFLTCAVTTPPSPCAAASVPVAAGKRIAGTQRRSAYAELVWQAAPQTELAAEWRAMGRVPVDDLNSDFAGGAATLALRASRSLALAAGRLELRARVDNVLNRHYVGSVIVNDGNKRYFEPASPRNAWLGVNWRLGW